MKILIFANNYIIAKPRLNFMRKSGISLLLMLLAVVSVWAQESKNGENKSLPPVIVEGKVENVPDGTIIGLYIQNGPYITARLEKKDTIVGGKFRIAFTPKYKNEEYSLGLENFVHGLVFYSTPGTTTIINGKGVDIEAWHVENDNPIQKEANKYRAWLDNNVPDYFDIRKKKDWMDPDDDEYPLVEKTYKKAHEQYAECMIKFMQDREFSPVFVKTLYRIAIIAYLDSNIEIRDKARLLAEKIPSDSPDMQYTFVGQIKHFLYPQYSPISVGEKMTDFVLYDHQDKEHHLTEFNGNGKYLLLEFNSRTCKGCMEHRPIETLNNLYKKHSDKVDILMVNCDDLYFWNIECKDPNKYGRDPWNEWNDKKGCDEIMQRYRSSKDNQSLGYYFVSPDGTILGRISDTENLQEAIDKYFKL